MMMAFGEGADIATELLLTIYYTLDQTHIASIYYSPLGSENKKMKRFTIIAQTSYRNGEREREKRQKTIRDVIRIYFFLLQRTCWF